MVAYISHDDFIRAIASNQQFIMQTYIAQCDECQIDLGVILTWAANMGFVEVVKLLVEHFHVDPARHDWLALKRAADNGQSDVVRYLCKQVSNNAVSLDILFVMRALLNGHVEIVKNIVKHVIDDASLKELCEDCKLFQIAPFLKRSMSVRSAKTLCVWTAITRKIGLTHWTTKHMSKFIVIAFKISR